MKLKYLKDVAQISCDQEKCIGCGMCENVCPHHVFEIRNKKAVILDKNDCMECGACAKNCPIQAISVKSGVGCAAAVIKGFIYNTEPSCDCSGNTKSCC